MTPLAERIRHLLDGLPDGGTITLDREALERWEELAQGEEAGGEGVEAGDAEESSSTPADTWRERLWTAPSECRIGVAELSEAMGVSTSWIYTRTKGDAEDPLPHGKIGNALTFKVGEIRRWIREHEDVAVAGPMDPPAEGRPRIREVS